MSKKIWSIAGLAAVTLTLLAVMTTVRAQERDPGDNGKRSPVGAWFGIARPCPADPVLDSPLHAEFCRQVCGSCPGAGGLPSEVPMMPTLLADGTVLADDAGEIGGFHTTANGQWVVSRNDGLPDRPRTQRFKATFFWLGSPPSVAHFNNAVRPRFVTYFDPADPDRMIGFIQPHFFPFVDSAGLVIVNPPSPLDPLGGNHIPATGLDPLVEPLPAGCQPAMGCMGTYHFVIRRIQSQ
jgi:hypothetical protein